MKSETEKLEKYGEELMYQLVTSPIYGHVVDYKVVEEQLIIVVEKRNLELAETPYRGPNGKGRPKKEKAIKIVEVTKCPECNSATWIHNWNEKRKFCINKLHDNHVFFDRYKESK